MNNKKFLFFFMGVILFICGCGKYGSENLEVFRIDVAEDVALEYMDRLQKGDIKGAEELATDELILKSKGIEDLDSNILAFVPGLITETGSGAYIEIITLKINEIDPRCDLDKYTFKVINYNQEYKIDEINALNIKEVFAKDQDLRMITSDASSDDIVLRILDLPIDIYPKTDGVKINKEKVPKDRFERIGISYSGDKIAFSTTDGKDTFLGLAMVEEANITMGRLYSKEQFLEESQIDEDTLKEVFEKPIAQKIIGYDILKDIEIKELFFTEEENELIVQYSKRGEDSLGLKIYKNPDGTPVEIDLESIFPTDKYTIKYYDEVKPNIAIRVNKAKGAKGVSQDLIGQYFINLKDETIDKI